MLKIQRYKEISEEIKALEKEKQLLSKEIYERGQDICKLCSTYGIALWYHENLGYVQNGVYRYSNKDIMYIDVEKETVEIKVIDLDEEEKVIRVRREDFEQDDSILRVTRLLKELYETKREKREEEIKQKEMKELKRLKEKYEK